MPSFSIEAPGEAVPLTETSLYQTLERTASHDHNQVQSGTKQLQQWEKSPGFYKHLQSVFISQDILPQVRTLAIILLKNGIDKYWRKTAAHAISQDDKRTIRSRLLHSALSESDARLGLQNAVVIAKIIRLEYPTDWPDALAQLEDALRQSLGQPHTLFRALTVVLYVVKELSTGRLLRSRQSLQAAAPQLLLILSEVYRTAFAQWHTDTTNFSVPVATNSLLVLRIIRRLLIAGYEFPHRDDTVAQFWPALRANFDALLKPLIEGPANNEIERKSCINKHAIQISKLHVNMAKTHPSSFVLLSDSTGLVLQYWAIIRRFATQREVTGHTLGSLSNNEQEEGPPALEKLSLNGILLTRACVKMIFSPAQTFRYKHDQEKMEKAEAENRMRSTLFTDDLVRELMLLLVSQFFTFTANDLIEWRTDAEEWESKADSDSEAYEYSIRLSSEKLFIDLIINFKELLLPPLLEIFHSVARIENENVLLKDSVYAAMGLSAAVYHQQIDFDSFLSNTLVAEVQIDKPTYNVLRRRIAVLIGQWATVKLSQENRRLVYQIYQHLLEPSAQNDLVVRIAAGRHLRSVADDWEFDVSKFLPFAEAIMSRLVAVIEEVEGTETKMVLLDTLGTVIVRLEHHIAPFSERIILLLPALWEQAEGEDLMKQAILGLLSKLINALKGQSAPFHSTLTPIIDSVLQPGSSTQLPLLDETLELWHAIVQQSTPPASAELLNLVGYLHGIIEMGSDSLRMALEISTSYLLLCPEQMLVPSTRQPTLAAMANLLDKIKPEASGLVNNYVETAIRSAERIGGEEAVKAIITDLVTTSFLPKQLEGVFSAYVAHCTTGPHAKAPAVDGVVETDYLSVLARLALGSTSTLLEVIKSCAPAHNGGDNLEAKMKWLLEEWFSHIENLGDPSRRKLMCLALTKLLETKQPFILENLQLLMTFWTDVVTELRDEASNGLSQTADPMADSLVYTRKVGEGEWAPLSVEDLRRRDLQAADPVHTIKIGEWIRHHLSGVITQSGGEEQFREQWLINVDKDVIQAFAGLGIM